MPSLARTRYNSSLTCVLFSLNVFVVLIAYFPSIAHAVPKWAKMGTFSFCWRAEQLSGNAFLDLRTGYSPGVTKSTRQRRTSDFRVGPVTSAHKVLDINQARGARLPGEPALGRHRLFDEMQTRHSYGAQLKTQATQVHACEQQRVTARLFACNSAMLWLGSTPRMVHLIL